MISFTQSWVWWLENIPNDHHLGAETFETFAQNLGLSVLEVVRCVPAGILCFLQLAGKGNAVGAWKDNTKPTHNIET